MATRRDVLKGGAAVIAATRLHVAEGMIFPGGAVAATSTPHDLTLNIGTVTYYDTQQMFLNVLKQAGSNVNISAWSTLSSGGSDTNEEAYLPQILSANGYPTTLTLPTPPSGGQQFTKLLLSALRNVATAPNASAPYPSGDYRWGIQGEFTATIGGDFTVPSQTAPSGVTITGNTVTNTNSAGTTSYITLTCAAATTAGFQCTVTAVPSAANPPATWTLVQSSLTSLLDAGQIFHPNFLAWLQIVPWKALRFMDTLMTNSQVTTATFASDPNSGSPLPALASAWTGQSGQRRTTLSTGEELQVTFTTGSTAVTSTANPTVTASSASFYCFGYDSWAARPNVSDLTYATLKGVPFEICMELCNVLSCDCWLNVPPAFQSSDWASFAALVTSTLNSGLKCFIEWSNEVWNGSFQAYHWALAKSIGLWGGSGDPGSYIGMSTALLADQLATTAGDPGFDDTFIVLMAGQAASTGWLTTELSTPSWTGQTPPWKRTSASGQKTIKGTAIAPYQGNGPIYAADFTHMQGEGDGGYSDFFATLTQNPVGGYTYHDNNGNALPSGGWNAIASGWVSSTVTALASYGALPIYCYEGSWQWDDPGNAHGQETFLETAARDARMAGQQEIYFRTMAAAGCTPAQYNFCFPYDGYQWGLIESVMQTVSPLSSAPARFQGAVNYVDNG